MKVEFLDCCVDWNDDYDVSDDVEMMETSCCGIVNNRIKPWGKGAWDCVVFGCFVQWWLMSI